MKKALYILIPLVIAVGLRLYPTLTTGMPFSTDGWPIIRNTELLLRNTPVPLNSNIFDGYDNFMPANSIFGAVFSQVTGLPAVTAMAIGIPLVGALAVPVFYVVANKITKNSKVSLIASVLLATAFPYAMFTAGVTKETYASPVYLSLILIFFLKHDWKTTFLFSAVSAVLILSHQATAILAVGILASMTVALYFNKSYREQGSNSNYSNITLTAILSAAIAIYYGFYAYPALKIVMTPSDVLTVASYLTIVAALVLFFVYKPSKPARIATIWKSALSFLVIAVIFFVATRIPLLPGAPALPFRYVLYALPFLISAPLIVDSLSELRESNSLLVIPVFWLAPILSLTAYALFANPLGGVGFAYRSLNFVLPPLLVLVAVAVWRIYKPKMQKLRSARAKLTKIAAIAIIAIMGATSAFTLFAAVSLQEPYLGYFWSYKPSEYSASSWVAANGNNQTITADVKTQYLLNGYFNVNVSVLPGLAFLEGNGSELSILYVYSQMKSNGYVLNQGSAIALPANWTGNLANCSIVYENDEVIIYAEG